MILESVDEIRAQGVTVYPHVVEKAQPLDVSRFNVPDWARWVAADSYGNVFSYSRRPSNDDGTAWVIQGYTYSMFIATINMVGIDWRSTLTAVNVEQPQPWCERCNLPEDICRGHEEITQPSPPVNVIVWQLSQLSTDGIGALARQLAQADTGKANMLAEALWPEAMDAEHARLRADDAAMEKGDRQAVWGDSDFAVRQRVWSDRYGVGTITDIERERPTFYGDPAIYHVEFDKGFEAPMMKRELKACPLVESFKPHYDVSMESATFAVDADCHFALSSAGAVE